MELRRALLLFAIVLGMAAIATSIARPPERSERNGAADGGRAPATPSAEPRPDPHRAAKIEFSTAEPKLRRLAAGRAATITVKVHAPGEVEIASLGLLTSADHLTPARFELLEQRPGRHPIRFRGTQRADPLSAGTLQIVR